MPLTALGGTSGTVVIGDTTTAVFPQTLHPNVMAYVAAQRSIGYTMTRVEIDAVNNFVWGLVGINIWDKMQALYPCIGNNAASFKWNLKDTTTFALAFSGTWTYASTGMKGNGASTSIANTNFNPATSSNLNDLHFSLYIRNFTPSGNNYIMGNYSANGIAFQANAVFSYIFVNQATQNQINFGTWTGGMVTGSRTSAGSFAILNNGFRKSTPLAAEAASFRNAVIWLGGNNPQTSGGAIAEFAMVSIGRGLTEVEANLFYVLTQIYQTELGRQV